MWGTASMASLMPAPVSLRRRLALATVAVLLFGMTLAAVLAWLAVEQQYLDTQRENLLAQARLTAAALQGSALPPASAEPYLQASNVAPGIHTRLIGESGAVILALPRLSGPAPVEVPPAEEAGAVACRVAPASGDPRGDAGQPAASLRRVAAAGNRRVLYAAAPVLSADGSLAGIAYLATPLPKAGLPMPLLLELAGAGALAVLLAGLAAMLLARRSRARWRSWRRLRMRSAPGTLTSTSRPKAKSPSCATWGKPSTP